MTADQEFDREFDKLAQAFEGGELAYTDWDRQVGDLERKFCMLPSCERRPVVSYHLERNDADS